MAMTVDQFVERVEYWRKRMCPEWHVGVTDDDPGEVSGHDQESWVACTSNDLTIAEILIHYRPVLLTYKRRDIDRIIVHELTHSLLDRVLDHDRALEPHVGSVQWEIYRETRRPDMEEFVNRMAHCIVDGQTLMTTRKLTSHS